MGEASERTWRIDVCTLALVAATSISAPYLVSLKTAVSLFNIKVAPVASFGVELIWEDLSKSNLSLLDRVKAAYLKRCLKLHSSTRNRLVYLMADTPLFTEELKKRFKLPSTDAFDSYIRDWEQKFAEMDPEFFQTGAMKNSEWKGPQRENRHVITRYAAHGFHHLMCTLDGHHTPNELCVCKKCNESCDTYHATRCRNVMSINSLSKM